jgi:hypothetical protein
LGKEVIEIIILANESRWVPIPDLKSLEKKVAERKVSKKPTSDIHRRRTRHIMRRTVVKNPLKAEPFL